MRCVHCLRLINTRLRASFPFSLLFIIFHFCLLAGVFVSRIMDFSKTGCEDGERIKEELVKLRFADLDKGTDPGILI